MEKKYSYNEVFEASVKYFNGDELAAEVFTDKYALRDNDGVYLELTPEDMHKRLAKEFARIEQKYPNPISEQEIFDLFSNFKYIVPQGSPMSAIGNTYQTQSAGNCFVIQSPLDSYGGICKTDQELVQLMKRRGGVGTDISTIRPHGMIANNAAKTTDGIAVFMERFSNSCLEVGQKGRRGAEIQTIAVNHPEIETFINIKKNLKKVTGANISIRVFDDFMRAVENDEDYLLKWPVDSNDPKLTVTVKAKTIWEKIIDSSWQSAEPGVLFFDTIIKNSLPDLYAKKDNRFKTISTNPCGEIPLGMDSCRLMAINLYSFVNNIFENNSCFDFEKFSKTVFIAQRLMDDLIDLELELIDKIIDKIKSDPEPDNIKEVEYNLWKNIRETCVLGRRTGLGITGLGDALAAIGIRYASEEAINVTEKIYKCLAINAHKSSAILAKERGSFPLYDFEIEKASDCGYLKNIWNECPEIFELNEKFGRRNIALTTTAPAGSVSLLTQTTSGIEPAIKLAYKRRKRIIAGCKDVVPDFIDELGSGWQEFDVYHHGFKTWMRVSGETDVSLSPYYMATANEINWLNKVRMQAVAQKWISHSISNTTNLPQNIDKKTVSEIYFTAWKLGCKGVTVYREGSRKGVLADLGEDKAGRPNQIVQATSPKRPNELPCDIIHASIDGEKWTVLVGMLNSAPYEIFMGKADMFKIPAKYEDGKIVKVRKGKYNLLSNQNEELIKNIIDTAGNDTLAWATRMLSMSLRHGIPVEYLVEQMSKDGCIVDFNNVLSRLMKKYIKNRDRRKETCPQCGSPEVFYSESCQKCSCGWSKCG